MWFDNHCHLTSLKTDPAEAVAVAAEAEVTRLLTVGCTVADSAQAIDIAQRFDNVWATAGVHPHDAKDGLAGLAELLDSTVLTSGGEPAPAVVAVGECGLDYHYDRSPRDVQAESFQRQIEMAHERDLALVIHTRDAWDDTFTILDRCGMPERTVFHCFTGGPQEAAEAVNRGAYLSFSGIVTFPSAPELREAAELAPLDRILVETDSPYLAPVPLRGKANKPANVAVVGASLADHLGHDRSAFAAVTTANANRLFGLEADG